MNSPISGALMGAAFFLCVFGVHLLDPTRIGWLLTGDRAQHYLGWEFFRHESWQFPLGRIVGFGTPDGSSVVFTDSIPLVAMSLKLLRSLLPQPFQYEGLWILACYCLQGFFGWQLATLTTNRLSAPALMTGFFLLSPSMMFRFQEGHHALMAHWTILAALYLALQSTEAFELRHPRLSWVAAWCLLLLATGLIHLYLAVMVLVVFGGAVASRLTSQASGSWRRKARLVLPPAVMAIGLFLAGAFVVSSSDWANPDSTSFPIYSMNLLSPLLPLYDVKSAEAQFVSYFLSPVQMASPGQREGFNYMGVGVWLLVAVLLPTCILYLRTTRHRMARLPLPVFLTVFALGVVALSYRVTIGTRVLYEIPVSPSMARWCEIFRCPGRFFWPASYLLIWLAFWVWGRLERRIGGFLVGLLSVALAMQVMDLSRFLHRYAHSIEPNAGYKTPLTSDIWLQALRKYDNIVYYPQYDTHLYVPLALLAAPRGISINVAYKARFDLGVLERSNRQIQDELETAKLRQGTLYVFRDQDLFERLAQHLDGTRSLLRVVDGYHVAGLLPAP